jgi:phosphohistidine swiveling domain-containing protein
MKNQFGINLKHLIIVSKQGYTTSYALVKDRNEVGNHLISKFIKCNNAKEIADLIKSKALKISGLMKDISEKDFTEEELKILIAKFDEYHNLHIVPRKMIDAASPEIVQNIIEDLKDARLAGETIHQEFDNLLFKFAENISEKTGYSPEMFMSLTRDEFFDYLNNHKLPDREELAKRYDYSGLIINSEGSTCITDPDTVISLEHLNVNVNDFNFIKGNTAFPGKVQGTVRLVFDPLKCTLFNKGDILVTGMTRPDYEHLMAKAGAIITDVGGLLCHASIIARELGKPCIIGTQSATKVLKEGDLVEVDATNGVIRRINA